MRAHRRNIGIKHWMLLPILMLLTVSAFAQTSLTLGVGLATPNSQINDVYNSKKLQSGNNVYDMIREASGLGYTIGARLRVPLGEKTFFSAGVGFTRFPSSDIDVKVPGNDSTVLKLASVQNIIPISAGVDVFLFKSFISPYLGGELQYNYISNTVDYAVGGVSLPLNIDTAPTDNRVGAALGAGMMLDLGVIALNIDGRYNIVNLIGKNTDEQSKEYLSLQLGVAFGWK